MRLRSKLFWLIDYLGKEAVYYENKSQSGKVYHSYNYSLGIYSLIFWHEYARDMNIICAGDGKKTRGILFRIIVSILTLGIYEWVWLYSAGERISMNTHSRNLFCNTTGTNVLLWYIFGSIIIIGPFIGLHKLIEGINVLAVDYNGQQYAQRHGTGANVTINNTINN